MLRSEKFIFATLLIATACFAQSNVGRISGTVTDSSGAIMVGSQVSATDTGTHFERKVTTDSNGMYVFPSLPVGTYEVRAESRGFKTASQTGVVLDAASQRTVNFTLNVGSVSESLSVSASAQQVQSESGDVSKTISETQLSQTPLNGRNYAQLLRLIPGSAATSLDPFTLQLSTTGQRINGIRSNSMQFTVDGADNQDQGANLNQITNPSVDAISEVQIQTSSFNAEFGGHSGAMVNVIGRSGTRQFHGTLYEFVRNSAFDARSFFAKQVDPLHFNDFGGTLGGPVFIPHKFNTDRNKLFFFFSEELKYIRQGTTNIGTAPTAAERSGDFRNSTLPAPVDPVTNQPFPNRMIPAARLSRNCA